jgi:hypothetical protein
MGEVSSPSQQIALLGSSGDRAPTAGYAHRAAGRHAAEGRREAHWTAQKRQKLAKLAASASR